MTERAPPYAPLLTAALAAAALLAASCQQGPKQEPPVAKAAAMSTAETLRFLYRGEPSTWPTPVLDAGVEWREFAEVPPAPHPEHNPHSAAKEELGRLLFHDGRLSGTSQMACASCHTPELGWADGRGTSLGHGAAPLSRNTPSVLNSGHMPDLFWDGRADGLEQLVLRVFHNPSEMRIDEEAMVAGLATSRRYRELFAEAFGDEEPTVARVVHAIACFCRTLNSDGSSDFDKFLRGNSEALSDSALRGMHMFRTQWRCANCHHGPLLSDGRFHNLGLSYYGRKLQDLGRYEITGEAEDVGRFKTPSLRNVARTGPYMHNGLFDLDGVLNMYSAGMVTLRPKPEQETDPLFPKKSVHLVPLDFEGTDKADLTAFLDSLTERRRRVRVELPEFGDFVPPATNP